MHTHFDQIYFKINMYLTDQFLNVIQEVATGEMPEHIKTKAKECLLDYLGVAFSGHLMLKTKEHLLLNRDSVSYASHVFGFSEKVPTNIAALLNGISSHVIELDDGHRKGAVHVGGTIFSALMAVAEQEKLNSEDFLIGVIVGYEATIRLACAVQPGNKLRGYHATGTCGTVGAALGIGSALHFTREQMNTTLAAAVTSAAGILEMQEDDSDLKPYNVGRAAMDAVVAAMIGRTGMRGPKDALGGRRGFLRVMTDEPHQEYLTNANSGLYCIEKIYQKVYAACRHAHPAIEAALSLRSEIDIDKIDHIRVAAYKLAVSGHDHTEIPSVSSAKMSIPFSVAVVLVTGSAGLEAFSKTNILNPKIKELTQKVIVSEDEKLTHLCPDCRVSILTIKMINGDIFTKRVDYPKGEPENPLSREELEEKFRGLAMYGGLTKIECDEVIAEIWKEEFSIEKIMNIICKK